MRRRVQSGWLTCAEFAEMWKHADPELQPRVKAARERLAQLAPVEKARRSR